MKRTLAPVMTLLMLLALAMPVAAVAPQPVADDAIAKNASASYIVRLEADPVVAYEGGIDGLAATKPRPGAKINPNSPTVKAYVAHLVGAHDATIAGLGRGAHKLHDYVYSFNGFSAVMSARQAVVLAQTAGVLSVTPDEIRPLTTDNSPEYLGLSGEGGLWEQLGGQGAAGENVIVGVVDTGIWPEHPSFADRDSNGKRIYRQVAGWHGKCEPGEAFNASHCNQKLIGAQYFADGFLASAPLAENEYLSPRDADGHGTHTASTAAGNANVSASVLGSDLGIISGMAPRARVAAYKACYTDASGADGCATSDLVAAIDQAVADGVDVINYSIGSSAETLAGPDDIAFLFAAQAGIFVATSNGNTGPDPQTTGSPATVPWVTSVGASTQDRSFEGSVTLGNGASYTGVTLTGGTDMLPIVDSADLEPPAGYEDDGNPDTDDTELCFIGALPDVTDQIVLCARGTNARVEKSEAVAEAGGAGMVLYNTVANDTLNTDNHFVPSLHVAKAAGEAIKAYIAGPNAPTAQIGAGRAVDDPTAPDMAAFSSRGPNGAAPDIIKPDVTAPGVNILAGATPTPHLGAPGQLFQAISGTSMSSPHVAGVGALLVQAHPDWTPAMIKSALMTTAHQDVDKEDGETAADPFDMGAGHIVPTPASDPGLVYNAGFNDYLAFLCGTTDAVNPTSCDALTGSLGFSDDPSDLNLASIGVADLAGVQTVTRSVTNVGAAAVYTASVEAPAGVAVVVEPGSLDLAAGETGEFTVTFTSTDTVVPDEWAFGSLTWSDGDHSVRSPLAVKPTALSAPEEVFGQGTDGSLSYDVTFGFAGPFTAEAVDLIPSTTQEGHVEDDPANDINTALGTCDFAGYPDPTNFDCTGITWHVVEAPAGTQHLRVSLFDDFTDGADDLDLYVFDQGGNNVASSGSGTSAEQADVFNTSDSAYLVAVHGWATDETEGGPGTDYTLFSWAVGGSAGADFTVDGPDAAVLGATATIDVSWTGLEAGNKYLGAVLYSGGNPGYTLVNIDTE